MFRVLSLVTCLALTASGLADEKAAPAKVGSKAPDFTIKGIDGKDIKLSEKLKGGDKNVVLLFSRANW